MLDKEDLIQELMALGLSKEQLVKTFCVLQIWLEAHYPVLAELAREKIRQVIKVLNMPS